MARKNRRNGHDGNRLVFWGVPLMGLVAALGMVYLHLFNTCESIGREIKRLESDYADQHKKLVNEERNWSIASSFPNMEKLMARHGIVMTFPEPQQLIRMHELAPEEPAQYAARGGARTRD